MDSDSEIENTPPELREQANSLSLLPSTSREKYETTYKQFMDWKKKYKTKSFSENIIMAYFEELSKSRKSSTLWSIYSMLKSTININHGINISTYAKLRTFLKRKSDGYIAKKAQTLTSEEINQFIREAPDDRYLLTKVVMVIAISGACRRSELWKLKINEIEDLKSALIDILDIDTHYFNLTEANLYPDRTPAWKKLYSMKEAYDLPDLSPKSFDVFADRFFNDRNAANLYFQ
uniref:Uncharacterized protein LOC114330684 n=1 Tax=Diabrotica virgifera virgifera TaxID=50390 RepID=A0A6P7FIG9_DIAVI